jgi:hypothetical protein
MNKYRKYILMLGFVFIASITSPLKTTAQPDAGCDPLDPTCPIDGGLSLLIAAGIGLGAKKAISANKKQKV